jgi:hypothetical protein
MRTDLHPSQLEAGDVLLCRGNTEGVSVKAHVSSAISATTSSPYTHAAMYLGDGKIVDARVLQGILVRPLVDLIASTTYIAALRQPGAWDAARVEELRIFAEELHGTKYNVDAFKSYVLKFPRNRQLKWEAQRSAHQDSLMEKIEAAFANLSPPSEDTSRRYFCSELVVAAFAKVGYLGKGADVIFDPAYMAPGDIPRDNTFGFLVGYLAKGSPFDVPSDDPLLGTPLASSVSPF